MQRSGKSAVAMTILFFLTAPVMWQEATAANSSPSSVAGGRLASGQRDKRATPTANAAWLKALGKWQSQDKTLEFELVDLNRAEREYYPNTPVKIEGYLRKTGNKWDPNKVKAGDLLFVSSEVEGDTISGKWLNGPQKGDCPKLPTEFSPCTIKAGAARDTLIVRLAAMQYYSRRCEWSDKTVLETWTYDRVR